MAVGAGILLAAVGIEILAFGWPRFLLDFWPLDSSRVGPNLIASVVTIVIVTAHNEARVVQKGLREGETLEEIAEDLVQQVVHPVEVAEASVAEAVIERQKE